MRKDLSRLLVTGGCGFIGSEFVRQAVRKGYKIIVVDKLTYAGDLARLTEVKGKYKFYKADICSKTKMEFIFKEEKPEIVVNFAGATHVDKSIINAASFIETNLKGTQIVLDASRKYKVRKYIHISSDEVYGEILKGSFSETSPLKPSNPYAASKAAADLFIDAYVRTYNFPAIIVRPCNNYGPWQYPEKFIPMIIYKAFKNKKIPVYGKGLNKREWLYVEDCVQGILKVMEEGRLGEIYNLGSGKEEVNLNLGRKILKILGKSENLIEFVKDRPGHDYRYFLNSFKMNKFGWVAKTDFEAGVKIAVNWYIKNFGWLENKVRCLRNYWRKVYNEVLD